MNVAREASTIISTPCQIALRYRQLAWCIRVQKSWTTWTGLHRHSLMTMIAYAFLQSRRLQAAGWRKKSLGTAASTEHAGG